MEFQDQLAILLNEEEYDGVKILKDLEFIGRICYNSHDRITDNSYKKFIQMLIDRGHESVLEHNSFTFILRTDRAIANELVRHRIASYAQTSTRYVNYNKGDNNITVIPMYHKIDNKDLNNRIYEYYKLGEELYKDLVNSKVPPEHARDILWNSLMTDIVATMNIRQWRHFIKLRISEGAHPKMRYLTYMIYKAFNRIGLDILFNDINGINKYKEFIDGNEIKS